MVMDKERPEHPRKSLWSKGRVMAIGLVMSALVLAGAGLVAHFLPGGSQGAAHASGGGGGGCVATAGNVCKFQGNTAFVSFFSSSPDGCIQTNGFVQAMADVTHSPPDQKVSGTTAFVSINQNDFCTGNFLDAFGQVSGVNFQADKGLNSASLNDSIPVMDFVSGNSFTVSVNVTWQGVGATSKNVDSNHFRTEGTIINSHFSGTSRAANVTGSISFGSVSVTTATVSPFSGGGGGGGGLFGGELQYAQSGSVDIFHQ